MRLVAGTVGSSASANGWPLLPGPVSGGVAQRPLVPRRLRPLPSGGAGCRGRPGLGVAGGMVVMAGLVLEPLEVAGPTRWRWLLRTENGEALATHEVVVPEGDFE